jgi:hypothetical protein
MRNAAILLAAAATLCLSHGCASTESEGDPTDDSVTWPGDTGTVVDAGPAAKKECVGTGGGSVALLHFGAFSDSQPPGMNMDDDFPTGIVSGIFAGFTRLDAQFVVGAGDWMFANTLEHAQKQISLLLEAESAYRCTVFHAMGNHECMTASASNCPEENESPNVAAYKKMLIPFSEHSWFSFEVLTSHGTARFVFTSTNAWDDERQGRWLRSVLQKPADYTFVIQHASDYFSGAETPGAADALEIARQYPVTLFIFGHAHLYRRPGPNELIIGTGGGTLNGDGRFHGFAMIDQLPDGNIRATVYDTAGRARDTWTVSPGGDAVD